MHSDPTPLTRTYPATDGRLGRKLQLDARSLPYMVAAADPRTLRSVHWPRLAPILDQGDLGACVGFAMTGALGSMPLAAFEQIADAVSAGASDFARGLYSEATAIDPWEGAWPPEDTGTDGLSAAKVLKRRGLISSYRHATSLPALVTALQDGPVAMGMPWMNAFFEPSGAGAFVDLDPEWMDSGLAGGHEVLITGVDLSPSGQLSGAVFTVANSWSAGWGDHGYFRMHGQTYTALRQDIDLIQLRS
jgi:hypothetical protein